MSALGKLIGVECAECRHKGHHCQAQMWLENEPVCLRCADGELCCYETANRLETPERLREAVDVCEIPPIPREELDASRMRFLAEDRLFSAEIAAEAKADLATMKVSEVAAKHGLSVRTVSGMKSAMARAEAWARADRAPICGLDGTPLKHRERASLPVRLRIGGEIVHMAPMACMGAELIGQYEAKRGRSKVLRPCPKCGVYLGSRDMRRHRPEHRRG
jgi:ssDNA-binding Zn-finger/Zn-ribbon topoisomerase 1